VVAKARRTRGAAQGANSSALITQKSRNNIWSRLNRYLAPTTNHAIKVLVGAVVGGFFSQVIVPSATPYAEMWVFDKIGWSLGPVAYRVIADKEDFKTREAGLPINGAYVTFHRIFCGASLSSIKYCLQHIITPQFGENPRTWKLASDKDVKIMLIGRIDTGLNASFIDRDSRATGVMRTNRGIGANDYRGVSYGCFRREDSSPPVWGWYLTYFGDLDVVSEANKGPSAKGAVEAVFQTVFSTINWPTLVSENQENHSRVEKSASNQIAGEFSCPA
jgi:hypothetical protein